MTLLVTNVSSNDTVDGKPWLPARRVSCVHLAVERVSRTGKIVAFERANVHRDKRAMSLPVSPREKRRRRCLRPVDEIKKKKKDPSTGSWQSRFVSTVYSCSFSLVCNTRT